jgi:hypothetical protein
MCSLCVSPPETNDRCQSSDNIVTELVAKRLSTEGTNRCTSSYVALVVPVLNTFRRWNHCGNFMQAFRYRPGLITTPDLLNKLANRPSTGECATPSDAEQRRPHVLAAHTVATVYSKACTMA